MIKNGQSDFLNLCRWIAASFVVIEHARSLIFVDFGSLESPSTLCVLFYFLTGFGHESVVVFFVISGFLVGGKAWELWKAEQFVWKKYLANRISRLYSVLIVALIIGGLLDFSGLTWWNEFGFYDKTTTEDIAVVNERFDQSLSINHFIGNILMLQGIKNSTYGSNGPLWSLAHEWWYYVLFPMVLVVIRGGLLSRLLCVAGLGALVWFLTPKILILFGIWILGVVAWWANKKQVMAVWKSLLIFAIALLLMRREITTIPYVLHFLVGATFALLLNSVSQSMRKFPLQRTSNILANFSYSLYLVHFPVLLFFISVWFATAENSTRLQMNTHSVALFFLAVTTAFLTSYLVALITEAKTQTIRGWLYKLIGVPSTTANRLR